MRSTLVIFSLLLSCLVHGQEMEIVNATERTFHGTISEDIVAPIRIKNISQKQIRDEIEMIEKEIAKFENPLHERSSSCL